jgi:modification methylase
MGIEIRNTDCLEGLRGMADDSVDCVVTSPPYNKRMQTAKAGNQIWKGFRIEYDCCRDDMSDDAYAEWMIKVLNEIYRVIKPAGSVFLNHKVILRDGLGHFPTWVFGSSLSLYQMIVWNRMCSSNMRSETLYPTHELIFWMVKGKPQVFKSQCRHKSDIWNILPCRDNPHPAPFPFELAENCISLACERGKQNLVVDPFAGSGTTAVAAKSCGFDFVGFEISPRYVQLANERVKETAYKGNFHQASLW